VSGNQVTTLAVGTCTIAADQAGNATWLAAPTVTRSFSVTALPQTISFSAIPDKTLGTLPFFVGATSTSGLIVSIVSQSTTTCSISNGTVTLLAVGTCTLVADQSGNSTYAPAPSVVRSFAISSGASGGGPGQDADAPIPLWAMLLLGLVLMYSIQRVQRQADREEFPS